MDIDQEPANRPEPQQDKMQTMKNDVEEVINVLQHNMDDLIRRETNMTELHTISEELKDEAAGFRRTSEKLACSFCLKNVKLIVVVVVVVLIIILIIVLLATGVIPVGSSASPPIIPVVPGP